MNDEDVCDMHGQSDDGRTFRACEVQSWVLEAGLKKSEYTPRGKKEYTRSLTLGLLRSNFLST